MRKLTWGGLMVLCLLKISCAGRIWRCMRLFIIRSTPTLTRSGVLATRTHSCSTHHNLIAANGQGCASRQVCGASSLPPSITADSACGLQNIQNTPSRTRPGKTVRAMWCVNWPRPAARRDWSMRFICHPGTEIILSTDALNT